MAEKDVSRITVERAVARIQRARALFRQRMPYGPTTVRMTPAEARRLHERMAPEERLALSQKMGIDDYLRMLEELQHGRTNGT